MSTPTIEWIGGVDGHLRLIDQTKLPAETELLDCETVDDVWWAIRKLSVRGAPAIGVAAAYAVVLATSDSHESVKSACDHLATSRPTAVNLFWALDRMRRVADDADRDELAERLLAEAKAIHSEDAEQCAAIGRHGADLLEQTLAKGSGILTHCNTGALATGGDGTALAVLFELHRRGFGPHVYADETRPLLQGSRLTMWELTDRGVKATLICDSMAAQVMREGRVAAAIVGADRIAANGDSANKIGTYGVALHAKAHGLPFYVAAPTTTFDLSLATGAEIPIEERAASEITKPGGVMFAPEGVEVYNPAFDVAPAELIAGIITERGVINPVTTDTVTKMVAN
ncbi:S-methyl-5-thioribose-1-phosphate isomerase [Aeoliella mucimassa]|uniref:Methylthioribose-1-phosphate isomerase n=1 Tax=Aeoliella mucimassa TaxID=2527972 RepID=A0A518AVW9_9BACT|nr:S-methyl-5-thioribose-1-phosphate isomerase [Aeoliella mucimassa]QDU58870.1 Methylthioribose-1-phosphate isomerase [Aeoliella mucimassa]